MTGEAVSNPVQHQGLGPALRRYKATGAFAGFDILGGEVRVGDTELLHRTSRKGQLVERRLVCLSMVALGASDVEIADKLQISFDIAQRERQRLAEAMRLPSLRSTVFFPAALAAGVMVVRKYGPRENFHPERLKKGDLMMFGLAGQGLTQTEIAAELSVTNGPVVTRRTVVSRIGKMARATHVRGVEGVVTGAIVTRWIHPLTCKPIVCDEELQVYQRYLSAQVAHT